jgi:hypothetical protein
MPDEPPREANRYAAIIEKIFSAHWKKGLREFEFNRDEIESWARKLNIVLPKNPGDLLYSFRFRTRLPKSVRETQPKGMEWRIELAGRARYRFKLAKENRILPRAELITI